jgi:hypothetical protein
LINYLRLLKGFKAKVAELAYALDLGCGVTRSAILLLRNIIPSKEKT